MWIEHLIEWRFLGQLRGTLPMQEQLWRDWFDKHLLDRIRPPAHKTSVEMQEEVYGAIVEAGTALAEEEKRGLVGFPKMDGHLVVGGYTIRSHFKDCARVISRFLVGRLKGESSFATKMVNGLYVKDDWLPILRDGQPIAEPDGIEEKPITAIVPGSGQRITAIKRVFYVKHPTLIFTLLALPSVKKVDLEKCMEYGAVHGYLGDRSIGHGRYRFTFLNTKEATNGEGASGTEKS